MNSHGNKRERERVREVKLLRRFKSEKEERGKTKVDMSGWMYL